MSAPHKRALVAIDEFGTFEAMVRTDMRWNGWAVCSFDIDEVSRMSEELELANRDYAVEDQYHITIDSDGVWEFCVMYAGEYADSRGVRVGEVLIDGVRYYAVGDGWCWSEIDGGWGGAA